MSSKQKEVYIMLDDDDEEWVRPTPAEVAITDAVLTQTELTENDLASTQSYVDKDDLRAVLEENTREKLTFTMEGYDVTVEASGNITVSE